MKTLQSFVASIKNASGLSHTLALIVGAGVLAYSTNASYKADVLALWGYVPHVLQVLLAVIAIPVAIYWNSQKNYSGVQSSQAGASSGSGNGPVPAGVCASASSRLVKVGITRSTPVSSKMRPAGAPGTP